MGDKDLIEEATKQLHERIVELRLQTTAGNLTDRIVDWVGDACTIVGLFLLLVFPVDLLSATLSILGIAILGYNHLIRLPRLKAREQERRRQIDMLKARVDRLERELINLTMDDR